MEDRKDEVMTLVERIQEIFGAALPIWFNLDDKGCVIDIKVNMKNLCLVTKWYDEMWYCAFTNEKIDSNWFDLKRQQYSQDEEIRNIFDEVVKNEIQALSEKAMYIVSRRESEKIEEMLGIDFIDCFRAKELPVLLKEYAAKGMLGAEIEI